MRSGQAKLQFICSIFATICISSISSAGLVVENGPATSNSFRIGGPESQVNIVAWTQVDVGPVNISALIGSLDGQSHTVDVYLSKNSFATVIASTTVTVGSFASSMDFTPVTLFSGLPLVFDQYYVVIFTSETSEAVNIQWAIGETTTQVPFVSDYLGSGLATGVNVNTSQPYLSNFTVVDDTLGFSVYSVPEPSSLALLGLGSAGLAIRAYRRRRLAA